MTSFRSNLNSVSSTYDGLTTAQNRLTTCFTNFQQKFIKIEQKIQYETLHYTKYQQQRGAYQHKWYQQNYKDSSLLKKANENLRNLGTKLKEIFAKKFRRENQNLDWEKGQIVGKLLSSTLIVAAQSTVPFECTTSIAAATRSTVVEVAENKKMTIMGDSFLSLREEYPDIDTEIRSILMARAQTGATIGEIKEDYRKSTGLRFPVYDHITDFLLCIPGVMAYCNERGTRIFNVRPTEKTKHIYDLVMGQKAPSERRGSAGYSNGQTQYGRENDFNLNIGLPLWRTGNIYRQSEQITNPHRSLMSSSFQNLPQVQQQQRQIHQQQQQFAQPPNSVDENTSRSESDGFIENRGGFYQDNCQYLFNRIYNYENNKENVNENSDSNYNSMHINENQHGETAPHLDTRNQIDGNQSDQNDKDMNIFKRPVGRAVRVPDVRASSPSATRSSQRSDSIYSSTDMEYEAHLLDFPLLGDDFFLYLARMELKCKFKKQQKVLQSGLCVSGQTIKAAINRIRKMRFNVYSNRRIIVNIGSVDIMQGKPLIQIEHEFRSLINIINKRGFQPILTTLAPLANYAHDADIKMKVERFNEFIKREGQFLLVIDIWALFVSERKQTLFDCYQNEPRQVTGASESYVFWNKIGRQRVLKLLESNLEY